MNVFIVIIDYGDYKHFEAAYDNNRAAQAHADAAKEAYASHAEVYVKQMRVLSAYTDPF